MDLLNIDCIEYMKSQNEFADLVITSPPYDNLRTYEASLEWNETIWKEVIYQLFRITKEGGVVVWIVSDATINGSETGTSFKQALYFIECGFKLHDTMVWEKPGSSSIGGFKTRYMQSSEYMFVFVKGKIKKVNIIKDVPRKIIGVKTVSSQREKDGALKRTSTTGKIYDSEFRRRSNVWRMPAVSSNNERTGHPAQFPEHLIRDHVISWSEEGFCVFDPFMGSGTTAVVCKQLNRHFVGCEKVKKYYDIACERVEGTWL